MATIDMFEMLLLSTKAIEVEIDLPDLIGDGKYDDALKMMDNGDVYREKLKDMLKKAKEEKK